MKVITRKERIFAALNHEIPDRVPLFDFLFQQPLYEAIIGRRPETYNARDAVELAIAINHDGVWLPFGAPEGWTPEYIAEKTYIDEWGTTYKNDKAAWPIDSPIAYPIKTMEDLKKMKIPDPTAEGRIDQVKIAVEMDHDNMSLMGGLLGPFTHCWLLMGYENICFALYDNPEILKEMCRISVDFHKEAAKLLVDAGCDSMWISDDLGDSHSGFFCLDHFHKYFLPPLVELIDYVDSLGVPVMLHSCGQISEYLPDLAQTKLASIHPLQRTAGMDLKTVKEEYGERFCIFGNIDSSRTLPFGTVEDVIRETKEAIDIAAPGGGFILGSDHSLHDGIPVENIKALFETGAEYGKYTTSS